MARMVVINPCDTAADWTALNDDCTNRALSGEGVWGSSCIEFDKANGSSNTKLAVIYTDVIGSPKSLSQFAPFDHVGLCLNISDLTNVDYGLLRLGTSASSYLEWRWADTTFTAGRWCRKSEEIGNAYVTGSGWDQDDLAYCAVGVAFDAETNTLADIFVDCVFGVRAKLTES